MALATEPISIVILAKGTDQAKSRLGLEQEMAQGVAQRLAHHAIRTALDATSSGQVAVVTSDRVIAQSANERGALVVPEGRPIGMNGAAQLGRDHARLISPGAPVAILVADLPMLRSPELDQAVDEFRRHCTPMYVADHHGAGTTFLIHGPDSRPGIAFGRNSATMHARLGYAPARGTMRGLRVDLDTPEDLRALAPGLSSTFGRHLTTNTWCGRSPLIFDGRSHPSSDSERPNPSFEGVSS